MLISSLSSEIRKTIHLSREFEEEEVVVLLFRGVKDALHCLEHVGTFLVASGLLGVTWPLTRIDSSGGRRR